MSHLLPLHLQQLLFVVVVGLCLYTLSVCECPSLTAWHGTGEREGGYVEGISSPPPTLLQQ